MGLAVLNLGMGIAYGAQLQPVAQQSFVVVVTGVLLWTLWKGFPMRWYLFAWLILMSMGFFFQGGQRMIFEGQDGGASVYISILGGLSLIGGAIFLGGNEEIALYLQHLMDKRKKA